MESARSVIARDFLDCADRFKRISARNSESAPRELQHAEAWAAKILKRAVVAGIVEVPEGFPWPETGTGARRPIDSDEFKWASSWVAYIAFLDIDRSATNIPVNLLAFQCVPGRSGVYVTSPGGTAMKAENFSTVCGWLSRLCAESADDASTTHGEPVASARALDGLPPLYARLVNLGVAPHETIEMCMAVIQRTDLSADSKLFELAKIDNSFGAGRFSASQIGDLLECSDANIRGGRFWKQIQEMKVREGAALRRAKP